MSQQVSTMLEQHHTSSSAPFFIYLSLQSVHDPLQVTENYRESFDKIKDSRRRTMLGAAETLNVKKSSTSIH